MDLSNKNIVHINKNGFQYLQFKKLLKYPEINHAYVLGLDRNFRIIDNPKNLEDYEKNEKAKEDYKQVCKNLNLSYQNIINTNQKHTNNIKCVVDKININEPDFNMYKNTDGLITNKKDIILSTINADCILLIFYDPVKKVIANIHSGWRGTLQRISVKTVRKMQVEYGCNPKDIICCMSPSIRKEHFEVDEDVYHMFYNEFSDLHDKNQDIYEKKKMKYNIDTVLINHLILENAGLCSDNIVDSGICSVCSCNLVHSYRVEGKSYRVGTQIISLN